jgi:1,2-diacylglycerol 3-alpha-glucosyltransferase
MEATLRIAMLTNLFHPVATGSSVHVRGLASALVAAGNDVIVITPRLTKQLPEFEVVDGVKIYRIPALHLPKMQIALNFPWLNWTFWPANIRRIGQILTDNAIDVIHVHNHMFDMAFTGAWLRRRRNIPLVVTLHTLIKHASAHYDFVLGAVDRLFLKNVVIDGADVVIAPDKNMANYAADRFNRNDAELITYGLDAPEPVDAAKVERVRSEFGLAGKRVILSLGHVHAIRNRHELIRAMPRIIERIPNVKLLVVGGIFDESPIRLASELGISDHVVFAGAQPRERIGAFLAAADVEAHWLTQSDAANTSPGIASMEAMNAGLAVAIVSPQDIYGPNLLRDGENVIVVNRDDIADISSRLISVLEDPERARLIGKNAAAMCTERFSWPAIASQTLDAYRHAIEIEAMAHSSQDAARERAAWHGS